MFRLFSRISGFLSGSRAGLDALLDAVYRQALSDLVRMVRNGRLQREQWERAPWDVRARALSAALFLADVVSSPQADEVARQIVSTVPPDEAEELLLGNRYGYTWKDEIPHTCWRCGRADGVWRRVFSPPPNLPAAYTWRYGILENHVPLCSACYNFAFPADEEIRLLWGLAVWGVRFDGWRWLHGQFSAGRRPTWDKEQFPLWPTHAGITSWRGGAGVVEIHYPTLWVLRRTRLHRDAARTLLARFPLHGKRGRKRPLLRAIAEGKGQD